MHLSLWIAAAGLLRVLPSCTASPIAAAAKPVAAKPVAAKPVAAVTKPVSVGSKQTSSSSSSSCGNASTTGVSADCWTTLGMNHYLSNWTDNTVIANAPMIGTIVCRSNEPWAQCFIRFAYGQQQKTAAPIDCSNPSSTSCKPPADMVLQPDSAEDYYGLYAIYGTMIESCSHITDLRLTILPSHLHLPHNPHLRPPHHHRPPQRPAINLHLRQRRRRRLLRPQPHRRHDFPTPLPQRLLQPRYPFRRIPQN